MTIYMRFLHLDTINKGSKLIVLNPSSILWLNLENPVNNISNSFYQDLMYGDDLTGKWVELG
jgi:hypothetical protein